MALPQRGQRGQEETRGAELHFHYNREERLESASESVRSRGTPQSFFRRYRGTLFLLLNVVILAAMVGLYTFLSGNESHARLPGYDIELNAMQFGDQALLTVRIRQSAESPVLAGSIVKVAMTIRDTKLSRIAKDILPAKKGEVRTIRAVLEPLPQSLVSGRHAGTAEVEVQVGDSSARLSMRMKSE